MINTKNLIGFWKNFPIHLKSLSLWYNFQVPNHLIWLTFFYLIFHSAMNTVAEIMQFADRSFYFDWWNSRNVIVFWKTWNLPVHRWCVRHVFKPVASNTRSKLAASLVVFFLSAFLHEYVISIPLNIFKAYGFLGMMFQVRYSQSSLAISYIYGF